MKQHTVHQQHQSASERLVSAGIVIGDWTFRYENLGDRRALYWILLFFGDGWSAIAVRADNFADRRAGGVCVQQLTSDTLTTSANPAAVGQQITLTATVSPSSATGSVSFYDNSTLLGTGNLNGGTATFAISTLADWSTFAPCLLRRRRE